MNYYVFSNRKDRLAQEDAAWVFVERFDELGQAKGFLESHEDDVDLEYRVVPAQTEEDAKAQLDMPNRPF